MRFGLICEDTQRVGIFKETAASCNLPEPRVLSYSGIINNPTQLQVFLERIDYLRLDSAGGAFETWQNISQYGGYNIGAYTSEHGRIYPLKPFMTGFKKCIEHIDKAVSCPTNVSADTISLFMDKKQTHHFCTAHSLPVPCIFETPASCLALLNEMDRTKTKRVFIKLRYGSAASGVLAVERQGKYLRVYTTVDMQTRNGAVIFFNSLKIRKYLDEQAHALIDEILLQFETHIEAWIPKFRIEKRPSDIRLLVIDGKPAHLVARCGQSPITNLHLGNRRMSAEAFRQHIPDAIWVEIQALGKQLAEFFPDHFCLGLDIGIDVAAENIFIIEINAFGDRLNNVLFERQDPYTYQIKQVEKMYAKR